MTDEIILFGDGLDQAIQSDDDWVLNTIRSAVEKAKKEKDVSIAMTSCQQLVKIAKTSGRGLAEGLYLIWKNWSEFETDDDDPITYIYEHVGLHRATVERYIRVAKMLNNPSEFGMPNELVDEIGQRNIKELIPIATALAQDYEISKKNWKKLANAADFTEVSKIIREDVKQVGARRNIVSISIDANGNLTAFNASGKRMPIGYLEIDLPDELAERAIERIIVNTGILRPQ